MCDREGNPRQRLAEFAVDWHTTRFGLRSLAELNLLDLLASVRHHYKTSVRVRWFGQFTGERVRCGPGDGEYVSTSDPVVLHARIRRYTVSQGLRKIRTRVNFRFSLPQAWSR